MTLGNQGEPPTLSQNRRDTRLSKLCVEITVVACQGDGAT